MNHLNLDFFAPADSEAKYFSVFLCPTRRGPSFTIHHRKSYTGPGKVSVNEYSVVLHKFNKVHWMLLVKCLRDKVSYVELNFMLEVQYMIG